LGMGMSGRSSARDERSATDENKKQKKNLRMIPPRPGTPERALVPLAPEHG